LPLFFYGVLPDFHRFAYRCRFSSMDSHVAIVFTRFFSWIRLSLLCFHRDRCCVHRSLFAFLFSRRHPFLFFALTPFLRDPPGYTVWLWFLMEFRQTFIDLPIAVVLVRWIRPSLSFLLDPFHGFVYR
jgi:hypothetical protein